MASHWVGAHKDRARLRAFLAATRGRRGKRLEYEELPNGNTPTIRLLTLLPGRRFDEIECRLKPSGLDADYEALSYCWGDPKRLSPITCNGCVLEVTRNLKMALNDLRHPEQERVLWVDAVCINQENEDERGA
jgi:hypothetical protein